MISTGRLQLIFFMILTVGVSVLSFFLFKPYIAPIFLAAIMSIVFYPLYKKLLKIFRYKKSLTSGVAVIIIFGAILIPSIFIGISLYKEAISFYFQISSVQGGNEGILNMITGFFEKKASVFVPEVSIDIGQYLQKLISWTIEHFDNFFSSFFKILIGLILMFVSLFYFLRDGDRMIKRMVSLSPLADSYDEQIIKKMGTAINSIVKGSLAIALIKGILTALGFTIFSIPNPILWGVVTAFASFIPIIGSSIVVVPAILYLFVSSSLASTIGFALWGLVFVGFSDNILSPVLLERGMKIHPFLILLSIFGGLGLFGPIGFIAGPVLLSLLFALFDIYPLITQKIIHEENSN